MKNSISQVLFLFIILSLLLVGNAYGGDITTSTASIDFLDDSNTVLAGDYKIDSKVIAVDSDGYVFSKVKIQTLGEETTCTKTQSVTDINGTKETVCLEYTTAPKVIKEEYFVAELSFNYCKEGQWYRIYKADGYYTTQEDVINNGYKYKDVQCSDNKLRFYVDSFSSYTQLEIDALQAGNILYWTYDTSEVSGSLMNDISSSGYDGTLNNGVSTGQTGIAGESFSFDGIDDFLNATTDITSGFSEITVAGWIYFSSVGDYVIAEDYASPNYNYQLITYDPSTHAGIDARFSIGANSIVHANYNDPISTDTWHFLVGTYDGTNVRIYVDNNEGVSASTTGNIKTSSGIYTNAGKHQTYFFFTDGKLDEFMIYNRALNQSEIEKIYNITSEGYNIYNYPTGASPITFNFEGQDPVDLNISNVPNEVNINFTIEGYNATAITPYLNYTLLSPDEDCIIYVNGVCQLENGTYIQTTAKTNTSTLFEFEADKDEFLTAVFNYNQTEMRNTPKLFYNTTSPNSYIRVDFDNLTNTCARANLLGYFNSTSAINRNVYYCNNNYASGNPALNSDCELVGSFNSINETDEVDNLSYYDIAELSYCGGNLTIPFSSSGSFMIGGGSVLSRHAYITNTSGSSFYTTNAGGSWTPLAGTWDIHFHHWDSDLNFTYYACGIGEDGGFNCSSTIWDTLEVGDSPQVPPILTILTPNDNESFTNLETINVSWFGFDINNDSLVYNLSINSVVILEETTDTSYMIPPNLYTGTVIIEVTAYDGNATDTKSRTITVTIVSTGGGITQEELNQTLDFYVDEVTGRVVSSSIIFIPIFLAFIFLILAATLDRETHPAMKIFLGVLSIPMVWFSLYFATLSVVKYLDFPEIQDAMGFFTWVTGTLFGVILAYFIIYLFYTTIIYIKSKREERLKY